MIIAAPELRVLGVDGKEAATAHPSSPAGFGSGADQNRTGDLLHAMQALYQLSYSPEKVPTIAAAYPGPIAHELARGHR